MKKQVVVLIAVMLIAMSSGWAQNTGDFPVPLTDPAKPGRLDAHINSGSITVKGTARKDVLIKYSSPKQDEDNNKVKDGLKRISGGTLDLEVSESNNNVKVHSNSWNNNLSLEIEVPSGFNLKVSTYNDGDLVVNNIQGELELTNYNGEITAEGISGSLVASTYNGEIKATFDKVTDGAPMSFSTYNGDIDLTFPSTLKASLKMRTDQGEILTGFDVNLVKSGAVQKKDDKNGVYRVKVDEWVKGDINGGGSEFSMKTYNGDIKVRKK